MASRITTLLVLLLFCYEWRLSSGVCNASWVSLQVDALLAEYDREAAPAQAPLLVQLDLDIRRAVVNEHDSTIKVLADLHLDWKDDRLAWNASDWGCEKTLVSAERLWLPDVQLINAAETTAGDPLRARLHSDGSVAWITRLDLAVPIAIQLRDWPKDTQTAVFKFMSRGHTIDELDITLKDTKLATVFDTGAWEVVSLSTSTGKWQATSDIVRRVGAYKVSLRRRAPAHLLCAAIVATAGAALLLVAALLPPLARAPLCAASAFTTCLWMISTLLRLPTGGGAAPRTVCLMAAICTSSVLTALFAALVQKLTHCTKPPPGFVRVAVSTASSFCDLSPPEGATSSQDSSAEIGAWAAAARLIDLVLLAIIAFVLFVLFLVYL